jgi:hypothetical protein
MRLGVWWFQLFIYLFVVKSWFGEEDLDMDLWLCCYTEIQRSKFSVKEGHFLE